MKNPNTMLTTAITGLLTLGTFAAATAHAAEPLVFCKEQEKCYGVSKAGKNDCSTLHLGLRRHGQAGLSKGRLALRPQGQLRETGRWFARSTGGDQEEKAQRVMKKSDACLVSAVTIVREPIFLTSTPQLYKTGGSMKSVNTLLSSAIVGTLSLGLAAGDTVAAEKTPLEKCYGVSKAGKNDCQTSSSACAGTAKKDGQKGCLDIHPQGQLRKDCRRLA